MHPVRVGIIGRRFGRDVHAPAFHSDRRCEVVCVVGRDDWREMVDSSTVDAVSIAVPPAAQPAVVLEAVKRGKHVFCEKPAASSVAGAREMLRAARDAGVVHGIDFLFPELAPWRRARELLAAGEIGPLRHFAYTWRVETQASRLRADTWKSRSQEGGGAPGNFVSHVFHNVEWLIGSITRVENFWFPAGSRTGHAVEGIVHVGDVSGTVSVSTDAYLGCGHVIELFGDGGSALLRNPRVDYVDGFELSIGTRKSGALAPVEAMPAAGKADGRVGAVARVARRFVDAITTGETMTPNLTHGVRVQELLSLAAHSGSTSLAVPLPAVEQM